MKFNDLIIKNDSINKEEVRRLALELGCTEQCIKEISWAVGLSRSKIKNAIIWLKTTLRSKN